MRARVLTFRVPLIIPYILLGCDPEHRTRPEFIEIQEVDEDEDDGCQFLIADLHPDFRFKRGEPVEYQNLVVNDLPLKIEDLSHLCVVIT